MLLFTQVIKSNRQLAESLTRVLQHPEVQYGILRITDGLTNGRIFVGDGSVFVGAELVGGKTGAQAVYRLLSVENAIVGFLQVPFEPADDSTFVDIRTLLYEIEQSPDIPLAEALCKIVGDSSRDFDTPAAPLHDDDSLGSGLMAEAIHKQVQKEIGKKANDTADGDPQKLLLEHINYYNKLLSQLDRAPYKTWLTRAELLNSDLVVYECLLEPEERQSECAQAMNRLRETLTKAISKAAETTAMFDEADSPYVSTSELFKPGSSSGTYPKIDPSHLLDPISMPTPGSGAPSTSTSSSSSSNTGSYPQVDPANRVDRIAVPASSSSSRSTASSSSSSGTSSTGSYPQVSPENRVDKIAMPASSVKPSNSVSKPTSSPGTKPSEAQKTAAAASTSSAPAPPKPAATGTGSSAPAKPAATGTESSAPGKATAPTPASASSASTALPTQSASTPKPPPPPSPAASPSLADQKSLKETVESPLPNSEKQPPSEISLSASGATEEFTAFDESTFPGFPEAEEKPAAESEELLMQLTSMAAGTKETKKPGLVALGENESASTLQTASIKGGDLPETPQGATRAPGVVPSTPAVTDPLTPPTSESIPSAAGTVSSNRPGTADSRSGSKPSSTESKPSSAPPESKPAAAESSPPAPPKDVPPPATKAPKSLDNLLSFDDEDEEANGFDSTPPEVEGPRYVSPGANEDDEFDPDSTLADPVTALSDALFERYESPKKKEKSDAMALDTSKPVRASALEDDLFATPQAEQKAKDTFSKLEFKPGKPGSEAATAGKPAGSGAALSQLQAKIGGGAAVPDGLPMTPSSSQTNMPAPGTGGGPTAPPLPGKQNAVPLASGSGSAPDLGAKGSASDTFAEGPSKLRGTFNAMSSSGQVSKLGTTPGARGKSSEALASALSQMFEGLEIDESELATIEEQAKKAEDDKKRFKQEIAEAAKESDMLSAAAIAGIRTQEAQASDKELRTELKSLRMRQGSRKRNIIIGGVAALVVGGGLIWAVTHPGGPQVSGDLDSARKHLKENYREAARQEVKFAIGKDPKNPEAHLLLGRILFEDADYAEALNEFKLAESYGAALDDDSLHKLAESAIKTKKWDDARATTERQLKKASSPKLLVQLGRIERDSGNTAQAITQFNKAIAGGYSAAYRERGELFFKMKQPKKALSDLDQAIKINDKDLHAHFLRGRSHLLTGDAKAALTDFAKAAVPGKADANVLAYQAIAFYRTGQYEKAVNAASKAIDMDRNSVTAYIARGDGYMAQKTYQRAVGDFDTVLQIDPKNSEAKVKRQAAYVAYRRSSGRSDITAQETIPVPSNLSADSLVLKGYDALRRGDTDEAIALLTAAVKKQPNDAMARLYLGHALLKAGQASAAAEQFQLAQSMGAQLRPLDKAAWADALLAAGRRQQAQQMYEQLLQQNPKLLQARLGLLRTYMATGNRKRAEALAREYMVDSSAQEQEALSQVFRTDSPPSTSQPTPTKSDDEWKDSG